MVDSLQIVQAQVQKQNKAAYSATLSYRPIFENLAKEIFSTKFEHDKSS